MLREPQHERKFRNHCEPLSVRPEPVEGLLKIFQQFASVLSQKFIE
jgi:hypothetical protein